MKEIKWLNHMIELVIVILGITIAFSIEKYAETRKEQKREAIYLASFLDEINGDIPKLDTIVGEIGLVKQTLEKLVHELREDKQNIDSLNSYISSGLFTIYEFKPQTTTFESLQSSGSLDLIQNFKLRKEIINYNHLIGNLGSIQDWEFSYHNEKILGYLPDYISASEKDLVKDSRLMALAQMRLFLIESSIPRYRQVIDKASELKKLIANEMDSLN